MSSDDDAEELSRLRRLRSEREGSGALAHLRELQRQAHNAESSRQQFLNRPAGGRPAALAAQGGADSEDDDEEDEDELAAADATAEDAEHTEIRSQFPLSFGKQEEKAPIPVHMHQQTLRRSFGPPKPSKPAISIATPSQLPSLPSTGNDTPSAAAQSSAAAHAAPTVETDAAPGPRPHASSKDANLQEASASVLGPPRPAPGPSKPLMGPPRPRPPGGDGVVGPPRPPVVDDDEEESDDDDEEDEEEDGEGLPVSHEVALQGHGKAVVALDVEHSGSRLVCGSLDYTLRIFDFNGMKADMKSFRELTPSDGHPVLAVSWSPSGELFLVVTGSATPMVYDRDGHVRGEAVRGDMYIRDMRHTKGHVSGCTAGQWHPAERYSAMTCSDDGTVRLWDMEGMKQKTVIKPTLSKPQRTAVTACRYSPDGRFIAAGLVDGTIQLWSGTGKFGTSAAVGQVMPPSAQLVEKQAWSYVSSASQIARKAHTPGTDITGLAMSLDGRTLASRGGDGTLKLWDVRRLTAPLHVFGDLPTSSANTSVVFSPDQRLVITGMTAGERDEGGAVVVADIARHEVVRHIGFAANVTALQWHDRLNQIFAGTGDRRSGCVRVLYDTARSERGVLSSVVRAPRRASELDFVPPLLVKTPHALPLFREEPSRRRTREKERQDPRKTRKPDPGAATGVGRQGRIGATGGTLLTQHLLKTRGKLKAADKEMDPREAILRHAGKTEDFKSFTNAYAATQPKPIFSQPDDDEDEEGDGS